MDETRRAGVPTDARVPGDASIALHWGSHTAQPVPAGVVKLADTQDLGSCAFERAGSSPAFRTGA